MHGFEETSGSESEPDQTSPTSELAPQGSAPDERPPSKARGQYNIRRILHVKCYCNGENCKINIAGLIFGLHWKSTHLLAACVVSVFALQLLNIVVNIFPK